MRFDFSHFHNLQQGFFFYKAYSVVFKIDDCSEISPVENKIHLSFYNIGLSVHKRPPVEHGNFVDIF